MKRLRWVVPFGVVLFLVGLVGFFFLIRPKPPQGEVRPREVGEFLGRTGEARFKEKLYLPLVVVYQRMLEQEPGNLGIKKKLALAYLGAGRTEEARALLEEIAQSPAADAEFRNLLDQLKKNPPRQGGGD